MVTLPFIVVEDPHILEIRIESDSQLNQEC